MKEKLEWIKEHPSFWQYQLGLLALLGIMYLWNWWFNGKMVEDFLEDIMVNMVPLFLLALVLSIVFYKTQLQFLPLLQLALIFVGFPLFLFLLGFPVLIGLESMLYANVEGWSERQGWSVLMYLVTMAVVFLVNFNFSLWLSRNVEAGLLAREAAQKER